MNIAESPQVKEAFDQIDKMISETNEGTMTARLARIHEDKCPSRPWDVFVEHKDEKILSSRLVDKNGKTVMFGYLDQKGCTQLATIARIVACVNACEGFSTQTLLFAVENPSINIEFICKPNWDEGEEE